MALNTRSERFIFFLLVVSETSGLSYNLPNLCPVVSWQINGTTVANTTFFGNQPLGLFIDTNNTLYTTDFNGNRTIVWTEGSQTPSRTIFTNLINPVGIFVTNNGDIYIDNGAVNGLVDGWSTNSTVPVPAMFVNSRCYGLFVDRNNSLYCSLQSAYKVLKISLGDSPNMATTVAGTGTYGATSTTLDAPTGIYVDTNFDLYVADMFNNRIQLFRSGQLNATTVAGNGAPETITLFHPTGVTMDGNGYLYIVDRTFGSIIRSGPNGYQCVVGCSGASGSNAWELNGPYQMAFDSYGNMFVMDEWNSRLQKFELTRNACVLFNQPKLCPNSTWYSDAITFANQSELSGASHGFSIDLDDTIYFPNHIMNYTLVWSSASVNPVRIFTGYMPQYTSVFLTTNKDMYFENGNTPGRIDKWPLNATNSSFVAKFDYSCYGLFVDINNTLYCSMRLLPLVMSISLYSSTNTSMIVAGNGTVGSAANQLNQPWGIFVTINFDLYMADAGNSRIQLFQSGQVNGTTVAGNGTPKNLTLQFPTDVVLDADGYLFIADNQHNRIIRAGFDDYECVAGCSGGYGSAANELHTAYALRFDSQGNIYVADEYNNRIQKFLLATNSCDTPTTIMSTTGGATVSSSIVAMHDTSITTASETTSVVTTEEIFTVSYPVTTLTTTSSVLSASCSNPSKFGIYCNNSNTQCDILHPCQNNGTCMNTNINPVGYICFCPHGFYGTRCQYDYRPCKINTCWNNGSCQVLSNTTFVCQCSSGWTGLNCETMINLCDNATCLNNGICRRLLLNYRCECLGDSYSGQHCEITANNIKIYQVIAISFASIAISMMISAALFIIMLDVLKYWLGIDVLDEDPKSSKENKSKKTRRVPVIIRYQYVHSTSAVSANRPIFTIEKYLRNKRDSHETV